MTPEDLSRLHEAAFAPLPGWPPDAFASLLSGPGVTLFTRPDGFALVRGAADEVELLTLAVHPDARRQGVGEALMRDWMHARKEALAFLEVASDNLAAQALYDKCGFSVVGRRKGYYRRTDAQAVDAVLMQASLTHGQTPESPPESLKTG